MENFQEVPLSKDFFPLSTNKNKFPLLRLMPVNRENHEKSDSLLRSSMIQEGISAELAHTFSVSVYKKTFLEIDIRKNPDLKQMFEDRYELFVDDLHWQLPQNSSKLEIDKYDTNPQSDVRYVQVKKSNDDGSYTILTMRVIYGKVDDLMIGNEFKDTTSGSIVLDRNLNYAEVTRVVLVKEHGEKRTVLKGGDYLRSLITMIPSIMPFVSGKYSEPYGSQRCAGVTWETYPIIQRMLCKAGLVQPTEIGKSIYYSAEMSKSEEVISLLFPFQA